MNQRTQNTTQPLLIKVQKKLIQYGEPSYLLAKQTIQNEKRLPQTIIEALSYFLAENWHNNQHPALIAAACQTVRGNPKDTYPIGAAIVLLTGAADIHDDIIDKSKTKTKQLTAYGKFGSDTALFAGDALLFEGLMLFTRSCEQFSAEKRQKLQALVEEAFFKIGKVAVSEGALKKNWSLKPEEYRRIMETKGAVAEACIQIGAIIGDGKPADVEVLAKVGRTLGFLMTVRNEFADLQYPEELRNRTKKETLPLPVLYAFKDKLVKDRILGLLGGSLTMNDVRQVADLVLEAEAVKKLKKELSRMAKAAEKLLDSVEGDTETFRLLLKLAVTDI